jgi:hypothetical protein
VRRGGTTTEPRQSGRRRPAEEEEDVEGEEDLDEEEPETPRAAKKRRMKDVDTSESNGEVGDDGLDIQGGWAAWEKNRKNMPPSGFFEQFKVTEEEQLTHALDEGPFASLYEHWIDELPRGKKKSWVCRNQRVEGRDDCALCRIGDAPSLYGYFNIVDMGDPEHPVVRVYKASPTVTDMLKDIGNGKRGPLNSPNLYLECQKVGGRHQWRPVKASELAEEWEVEPLDEDELADLAEDAKSKEIFKKPSATALKEIAELIEE